MKNLKVSAKLLVGFGIAVLFTVIVGVVGIYQASRIDGKYNRAIEVHGKPLVEAGVLLEGITALRSSVRGAIIFSGNLEKVNEQKAGIDERFSEFEKYAEAYRPAIVRPEAKALFDEAVDAYEKSFKPEVLKIVQGALKGTPVTVLAEQMAVVATPAAALISKNLRKTMEMKADMLTKTAEESEAAYKYGLSVISVVILAGTALSVFLGVYISRLISRPLGDTVKMITEMGQRNLSQRLNLDRKDEIGVMAEALDKFAFDLQALLGQISEAVSQVASASAEISDGSQSLAEGSNEQASSIEEVSSSLEEMSSMTKQNADNSNQAMILASEASAAAKDGDTTIRRMANAINQIKQSSDKTAKIVKSIDDIAFQTNLLALNAAVEAARAGEAGKGFAVVAEEVRNLAMRSADAAKSTANMIEESVKNADNGVKITEEVAVSLGQIVNRTGKVGDLIAEIAAASKEQAQGIEQVNTAVAQMNQVTQQNASSSEESASAAEELNNQAAELAAVVGSFKLGGSVGRGAAEVGAAPIVVAPHTQQRRQQHIVHNSVRADRQKHQSPIKSARAVQARELIPLDEEELAKIF